MKKTKDKREENLSEAQKSDIEHTNAAREKRKQK
jgi:hypothetical protein